MGLLQSLWGSLSRSLNTRASLENPSVSLTDIDAWEDLGWSTKSSSGVKVTAKRALGYAPVWRGINLLSNGVAKLPIDLFLDQGETREKAKSHPAYKLLRRRPNSFITALTLKKTLTYHAVFYGNGYAAIIRDGRNIPLELAILDPSNTFPVIVDAEVWYVTNIRGERRKIPAADVLHIKGLSHDGLIGYSVIEVMKDALGLGIASRDFAAKFFSQGANASGILMIPGHLKPEAIRQAIKDFEQIASGVKNSHKVGLLQDGVKWQPMSIDPQKSMLIDVQEHEVRTVANILGIPPHKLGDSTRTSYSSLEQENQSWLEESLDPWLCQWEDEANTKLLTEEEQEDLFWEFNRAALLKTDLITRYRAYAVGRQWGWISANDVRHKENMSPIEGGDVYLSPGNMTPVENLGEEPPDPTQIEGPDADADAARHQLIEAIMDRVERLDAVEQKQLLRAAITGKNFIEFVDEFFESHRDKLRDALTPLVRVFTALQPAKDTSETVERMVEEVIKTRREAILRVSGEVTKDSLPAALQSLRHEDVRATIEEILSE